MVILEVAVPLAVNPLAKAMAFTVVEAPTLTAPAYLIDERLAGFHQCCSKWPRQTLYR